MSCFSLKQKYNNTLAMFWDMSVKDEYIQAAICGMI